MSAGPSSFTRLERILLALLIALVIQSAWLHARSDATLLYGAMVFSHLIAGVVLAIGLLVWLPKAWRACRAASDERRARRTGLAGIVGAASLLASVAFAAAVVIVGNTKPNRWMVATHAAIAAAGAAILLWHAWGRARAPGVSQRAAIGVPVALAITLALAALAKREPESRSFVISNPALPPLAMEGDAMGGAAGPFFPSSIKTTSGGRIPSKFFLTSETCGRAGCHPDITAQWRSSMHHFASFNNQFYRKSIEYMQSVVGVEPSKWCAGCHDVALLLDGKFDRPVGELVHLEEAQAGLACTACHAIQHVEGSMGQGGYEIEYPALHDLSISENPFLRFLHDGLLHLDPEPHGRVFLKPFHGKQRAEFCSSCHKVHLDVPVNSYRWMRGFNDYDNWQASGVSGQGARAFYYPDKPSDCADCHMPLTPSQDAGNDKGFVHAHHFAAANTAVPTANGDAEQIARVAAFLKDKVTTDIFALSRETPRATPPAGATEPMQSSHFASGEEVADPVGALRPAGRVVDDRAARASADDLVAPIDRAGTVVRRGESVRVDVVVRTRGVGHFFPGGTVDAFDVWLELRAEDETGRAVFWSGSREDGGKGPVESGAHAYRSFLLDGHGNPIDKRNAWAARSTLYVRLIPPGAADTVRYRIDVPADCGNEIRLTAKLNHRKFAHSYTQFAYAGEPQEDDASLVSAHFDDRTWAPTGDTSGVSGALKEIPDLPVITIHESHATLKVIDAGETLPESRPSTAEDRGRWNDYGIGLLLQGDLRAALGAFERVTELDPAYAAGFVNIARVRLREGDPASALAALDKALALEPELAGAHYFKGVAFKVTGRLEDALSHLFMAHAKFPRDRVVLNDIARTYFLRQEFEPALAWGRKVLDVDPEDLTAHYTLMLAARGAGDEEAARTHEALYRRFKADEDAQILTGDYRRLHPEANNERQPIHEHRSVALDGETAVAQ